MYPNGASLCGALDISGNLKEWCLDNMVKISDREAYTYESDKIVRGGSFDNYDEFAAAAFRDRSRLNGASDVGLRVVCGLPL